MGIWSQETKRVYQREKESQKIVDRRLIYKKMIGENLCGIIESGYAKLCPENLIVWGIVCIGSLLPEKHRGGFGFRPITDFCPSMRA